MFSPLPFPNELVAGDWMVRLKVLRECFKALDRLGFEPAMGKLVIR